jgi:hypothetical protein
MKLFDDMDRAFTGYATRSETTFNYLNRSARPDVATTRDVVEEMFKSFPESGRADLRARFRSSNAAHSGAFFELFLFSLLRKFGYEVVLHPSAGAPTTRRVDFQVEANGNSIFIEARTLTSNQEKSLRGQLLAPVLDAIDGIESQDFFLHVEIDGNLEKAIAIWPIKKFLIAWLKSLDYDKVRAESKGDDGHSNLPTTKWKEGCCTLEFTAWPKVNGRGKPGRAIGIEFGGAFWNNTGQRLRKILSAKARRYGKLNAPYIIAVNVMDGCMDDECAIEALYGQEALRVRTFSDGRHESRAIRKLNGLWRQHGGPRYTRVSAVLIASRLRPWCMPQSRLTLYLNPWAEFPLSDELSTLEVVRLGADGHLGRTGEPTLPPGLCPALLTDQA